MLIPLQLLHHIETAAGMKITRFCKGLRMANIFAQIIVKNIANKELAFAITSSVNKHDYSSSGASIDVYKVTNLIGHIERSCSGNKMNSSCKVDILKIPNKEFCLNLSRQYLSNDHESSRFSGYTNSKLVNNGALRKLSITSPLLAFGIIFLSFLTGVSDLTGELFPVGVLRPS